MKKVLGLIVLIATVVLVVLFNNKDTYIYDVRDEQPIGI